MKSSSNIKMNFRYEKIKIYLIAVLAVLMLILIIFVIKKYYKKEKFEGNTSKELFTVYNFDKKFRLGENGDGGYVLGDIDCKYDCYISAGVSNEESFSRDFINKYNMNKNNSYAFDGTIVDYPYHYTDKITYIKKNINNFNDDKNTDLSFLCKDYNNIFLKMDIEGGEYPWLLNITDEYLNKIKQIVIELHGMTNDRWGTNLTDKIKCFEKLNNTHYIIHAHGNNYSNVDNDKIPDVMELTYIHKNFFNTKPELNKQPLPIKDLDFPNNISIPDLNLNFSPFVSNNLH